MSPLKKLFRTAHLYIPQIKNLQLRIQEFGLIPYDKYQQSITSPPYSEKLTKNNNLKYFLIFYTIYHIITWEIEIKNKIL